MKIHGIIVPILTPMKENGDVNLEALKPEIDRLIEAGVHGIFAFGTNGEGYILSPEEKREVLAATVEYTAGRVPVYAGTGCISTRDTIELSCFARKAGADVLSIITPWFAAASQEELYRHYREVAEHAELPVLLYNIPARTGNALSPATVERLAEIPEIVGVKDSSGNFDNILQDIERTRGRNDFAVLSGNDSLILWTLMAGGRGGVSGCANVFPKTLVSIYERFTAGDIPAAREAQDAIRPFRNCFRYGNPNTIVKTAAAMLGHPVGPCRAPFNSLADEGRTALEHVLWEMSERGIR